MIFIQDIAAFYSFLPFPLFPPLFSPENSPQVKNIFFFCFTIVIRVSISAFILCDRPSHLFKGSKQVIIFDWTRFLCTRNIVNPLHPVLLELCKKQNIFIIRSSSMVQSDVSRLPLRGLKFVKDASVLRLIHSL